ncbi:MAG TPA: hypothetical protein VGR62_11660 [Candidatus Binatia bacterium]|jgi:hypothetical protein|nr:hypothetical protein [Candidatus Binatia bacterium]
MRTTSLLVLLLTALPVWAGDLAIKQRTTTTSGDKSDVREETQYITATKMVVDGSDARTIVDVDKQTVTVADKEKKTWFQMTFADMREQAESVQKQIEKMPPEARKQMEAMLGKDTPVTITPTGKTETIAGYPAAEHTVAGGPFNGILWATTAIAMPEGIVKWRELSATTMAAEGPGRRLSEALAKVKGVPLRTTMTAKMGPNEFTTTAEAVEVKEMTPPADLMRVPDGFTKVETPKLTDE